MVVDNENSQPFARLFKDSGRSNRVGQGKKRVNIWRCFLKAQNRVETVWGLTFAYTTPQKKSLKCSNRVACLYKTPLSLNHCFQRKLSDLIITDKNKIKKVPSLLGKKKPRFRFIRFFVCDLPSSFLDLFFPQIFISICIIVFWI